MDIYKDIMARTGGDIYIGVVGPVRTGKSTFITEFMQKLVIPSIADANIRQRALDELPQSSDGKTIMTTQPHFVPNEAVTVDFKGANAKVRLIDCVGYLVDGAMGHIENNHERLVKTPWSKSEMPFSKAAETGTYKVVTEHSTIAVVVTTDGSFSKIDRNSYIPAEERVLRELSELKKPYVVVLNTTSPHSESTAALVTSMKHKYNCEVIAVDVLHLEIDDINSIMYAALSEFPVKKIEVEMPKWMRKLPKEHWLISDIIKHIKEHCDSISKMKDCEKLFLDYNCNDSIETTLPPVMNMGTGLIKYEIIPKQMLYYKILSELCAVDIFDDFALMSYISDISKVKEKFEKIAAALNEADESGYGVARPPIKDMELYPPEITKHGNRYGVIMKASAPAYHIMKVDVKTEVSPMMGTEEQSRYMLGSFEDNPQALWETNMFGKTLAMLAEEGLADKLTTMPLDLQNKLRRTVGRIVNENKSNMFCMLF